ncbi:hypothetical protein KXS07_10575 [Inquilinus limosus]|uniref:hypothetical protein n=1 Tax=Inquilinus limosus TaxID=171674 RepID=UPI003F145D51
MQSLFRLALAMGLSGLLPTACHDSNAADAAHFQAALQRYYDAHPECVTLPFAFPLDGPADTGTTTHRSLDVLVKIGLVRAVSADGEGASPAHVKGMRYGLTRVGEEVIKAGVDRFMGGSDLCFAHRRIVKVTSFTDPAAAMGVTSSRVTYDYELTAIEPWARDDLVQDAFPGIRAALTTPISTATDGVVLTRDGWQHERAAR